MTGLGIECGARDCSHNRKGICQTVPEINDRAMCVSCQPDIDRVRKLLGRLDDAEKE